MQLGAMQDWQLLVTHLIDHAAREHGEREIVKPGRPPTNDRSINAEWQDPKKSDDQQDVPSGQAEPEPPVEEHEQSGRRHQDRHRVERELKRHLEPKPQAHSRQLRSQLDLLGF